MPVDATLVPRLCSQCGYDVRGVAECCPECGFELALQPDVGGEIPWSFRRPRGRTRAFASTVVRILRGGDWIDRAMNWPVSLVDARHFRTIVATVLALPFIGGFVTLWIMAGSLGPLAYLPDPLIDFFDTLGGLRRPVDRHVPQWVRWDLLLPLSAGWTRPGVGVIAFWLTAFVGCGAHAYFFAPRRCPEPQRTRAYAFSYYLCGPLALATLPLTATIGLAIWLDANVLSGPHWTQSVLVTICMIASGVALLIAYVRMLSTLRRTTHCSTRHVWWAAIGVPIGWLAAALLGLGVVPWMIGYVWTLYDAFARLRAA